jgi:hypothetical protein
MQQESTVFDFNTEARSLLCENGSYIFRDSVATIPTPSSVLFPGLLGLLQERTEF